MATSSITVINPVASNAQMSAATATNVVATPGTIRSHPGVAKAWCVFNGLTTGTNSPLAGYNVTSVVRNSTGAYTINFTTSFSSANYAITTSASPNAGNTNGSGWNASPDITASAPTGSSIRIITGVSNGAPIDSPYVSAAFFGN